MAIASHTCQRENKPLWIKNSSSQFMSAPSRHNAKNVADQRDGSHQVTQHRREAALLRNRFLYAKFGYRHHLEPPSNEHAALTSSTYLGGFRCTIWATSFGITRAVRQTTMGSADALHHALI